MTRHRSDAPSGEYVRGNGINAAFVAGVAVAMVALTGVAAAQSAPIVQPGAPGEASRSITPDESIALGASRFTEDDVRFMQHMIVHHGQAVDMVALIADRSTHDGVRLAGQRISLSQATEIEYMRKWLTRRGQSTEMQMDHDMGAGMSGHDHKPGMKMGGMKMDAMTMAKPSDVPLMKGMLSPKQMVELAAAEGANFDRLFLSGMIHHHQGALYMVDELLKHPDAGEDPELSEFLTDIVADQSAEILRMQSMLSAL